jgi:hypothetical protein
MTVSRRHRILIAAAVTAALGPRAIVRRIEATGWSQLHPGHQPAPKPRARPLIVVHVRTARREKTREIANLT